MYCGRKHDHGSPISPSSSSACRCPVDFTSVPSPIADENSPLYMPADETYAKFSTPHFLPSSAYGLICSGLFDQLSTTASNDLPLTAATASGDSRSSNHMTSTPASASAPYALCGGFADLFGPSCRIDTLIPRSLASSSARW